MNRADLIAFGVSALPKSSATSLGTEISSLPDHHRPVNLVAIGRDFSLLFDLSNMISP
jgi:hypothetical protein